MLFLTTIEKGVIVRRFKVNYAFISTYPLDIDFRPYHSAELISTKCLNSNLHSSFHRMTYKLMLMENVRTQKETAFEIIQNPAYGACGTDSMQRIERVLILFSRKLEMYLPFLCKKNSTSHSAFTTCCIPIAI